VVSVYPVPALRDGVGGVDRVLVVGGVGGLGMVDAGNVVCGY
jgi:hypothetical protein